jgi:hypothetical protein
VHAVLRHNARRYPPDSATGFEGQAVENSSQQAAQQHQEKKNYPLYQCSQVFGTTYESFSEHVREEFLANESHCVLIDIVKDAVKIQIEGIELNSRRERIVKIVRQSAHRQTW